MDIFIYFFNVLMMAFSLSFSLYNVIAAAKITYGSDYASSHKMVLWFLSIVGATFGFFGFFNALFSILGVGI